MIFHSPIENFVPQENKESVAPIHDTKEFFGDVNSLADLEQKLDDQDEFGISEELMGLMTSYIFSNERKVSIESLPDLPGLRTAVERMYISAGGGTPFTESE
jgi:hypothetical protein